MRPRRTQAESGSINDDGRIGVWSTYEVDGVRTSQLWDFTDVTVSDTIQYDCLITIENVGHATDAGWRHVILTERQHTAGISCGMRGVAMDYVLYPGKLSLEPGEKFTTHVRHLIIRSPELPTTSHLEDLWRQFESDNDKKKKLAVR